MLCYKDDEKMSSSHQWSKQELKKSYYQLHTKTHSHCCVTSTSRFWTSWCLWQLFLINIILSISKCGRRKRKGGNQLAQHLPFYFLPEALGHRMEEPLGHQGVSKHPSENGITESRIMHCVKFPRYRQIAFLK